MVLTATEKLRILATGKATLKELNELEKQVENEQPEPQPEPQPENNEEVEALKKQLAEKDEALKRAQLKAQHEDISDKTDYSDVALSNIIKGIR